MSLVTLHRDRPVTAANLVWENPPPARRQHGKYAEFAAALRENPSRWAVIETMPAHQRRRAWSRVTSITSGKLTDFRNPNGGTFEATCRTVEDQTRVYVRFVPTATPISLHTEAVTA